MVSCFYEGEADSSTVFINSDDANLDHITYSDDIAWLLVVIAGHFVDVEQSGQAVIQFNNCTEFKNLNNLSVNYIVNVMVMDRCLDSECIPYE